MLERWIRAVLRWRWIVIATWFVISVIGVWCALGLPSLLTTSLSVPGTSSAQANIILVRDFHENIEGTFTVVDPVGHATPSTLALIDARLAKATRLVPTASISEERAVAGVVYANIDTSLNLEKAAPETPVLRRALHAVGLDRALVTGPAALQYDITPVLTSDLHRGEAIAFVLALMLLLGILGVCWAVLLPFLVAGATTAGTLIVVYALAHVVTMVLYVPNVIELIGLALAIDYSLLIVHRYRTEIDAETHVEDSIVRTMDSAGRTIITSGCAVAIGLATLFIIPVPFVRSLGVAGIFVPLFAISSAVTLQPVLLQFSQRRGVTPIKGRGILLGRDVMDGAWSRIASMVLLRPRTVLGASLVVVLALAGAALWLQVTPGSITAIPQSLPSARALHLVDEHVGPGVITPIQIVIDTGKLDGATSRAQRQARLHFAEKILDDPNVVIVAIGKQAPFVDASGRYEQMFVIASEQFGAPRSQALVATIRAQLQSSSIFPAGTRVYLGGAPAQGVDFLNSVYGAFPWLVALALLLAFLLLARAFRSVVLAALAVALDVLSIGAAYGCTVLVFRFGVFSPVLGTYRVSQIEGWVPVFLFATLFGLSMDYEVFIVSRIREYHERGRRTPDAIHQGLARTGGVVTSAAVIMVVALSGLVIGHVAGLQELGVGLSAGVLVDATIVRGLLVPSAMALLGEANWWLPVRRRPSVRS